MSDLRKTTKLLKALADENRLRILALLSSKPGLCVCEITEIIGLSQPTVSSHLKLLDNAGLLEYRKEGLWVNYDISGSLDGDTRKIINMVLNMIEGSAGIKKDISRLPSLDRRKICSRKV